MKKRNAISSMPKPATFVCSEADFGENFVVNLNGARHWSLLYTAVGGGYFKHGGRTMSSQPGDVVLIRPGTAHEYGFDRLIGSWKNIWAHFNVPSAILSSLRWPEVLPGHMY